MLNLSTHPWLKSKGYLHLTPKINVDRHGKILVSKITNPKFVSSYSFFPLLHAVIKERRYRKDPKRENKRFHTKLKNNKITPNAKKRPLHYATHMDALIFGYYGHLLSNRYEDKIKDHPGLSEAILAYRKIPIPGSDKNQGTIHFAHSVFEHIKQAAIQAQVGVLKFDLESFFNQMDHEILKSKWLQLFNDNGRLPPDHFNVFKAATKFSYVLKDDLRLPKLSGKRRKGFDEKKLAEIRNKSGKQSFFASTAELRDAIKSKRLRVYKYPFRNKETGRIRGIPQGLPISSVLANLYLLDFDIKVLELADRLGAFYRRYSDDIVIVCKPEQMDQFSQFIKECVEQNKVKLSDDKTEIFIFENIQTADSTNKLISKKYDEGFWKMDVPLTYLGFDFFGYRTSIKSANLAKFYRRMIKTAKRKCLRAKKIADMNGESEPYIFYRQLRRLYTQIDLSKTNYRRSFYSVVPDGRGGFKIKSKKGEPKRKTNYLSYVVRASNIMNEPGIKKQIKRRKALLRKVIKEQLTSTSSAPETDAD